MALSMNMYRQGRNQALDSPVIENTLAATRDPKISILTSSLFM